MPKSIDKTVNLDLVGLNGNAFNLLAHFKKQAQKEGWTKEEIDNVIDEATDSSYAHLVSVLIEHCDAT